ncbi:hypothetical protein [Streptomyces xiaopingdaonensis]|uniref:hypothetical protein n=1 Tax=Streptomyces xiaopingdaonensis TaxID=1565415 RepID=UPI0002EF918E|nr:hypothetical protein [Streptomyces xiaopingdaonensis]
MAFGEEWAQLKQHASERAAALSGGREADGHPQVRSSPSAWGRAAEDLGHHRRQVAAALRKLEQHRPAAEGIESGPAWRALHRSWERYLTSVEARCSTLQHRLHRAGTVHHGNDAAVATTFTSLDARYGDTPGSPEKG